MRQAKSEGFLERDFGPFRSAEKNSAGEGDKEKKESLREQRRGQRRSTNPLDEKIDGLGREALLDGHRFGGALYVLKKDASFASRVGVRTTRRDQAHQVKALAAKALDRLIGICPTGPGNRV